MNYGEKLIAHQGSAGIDHFLQPEVLIVMTFAVGVEAKFGRDANQRLGLRGMNTYGCNKKRSCSLQNDY
jgi:hypothetical protein